MFIVITKRRASLATSPLGWLKSAKKNGEGEQNFRQKRESPKRSHSHHPCTGAFLQQLNAQAPNINLLNKPSFTTSK